MTALTIFRTRHTSPRGPIQPMSRQDAIAWQRTRELHPHLYVKESERG